MKNYRVTGLGNVETETGEFDLCDVEFEGKDIEEVKSRICQLIDSGIVELKIVSG